MVILGDRCDMVDYKRVYTMTNENVASFKQLYNFDMANVLTVLGSGDQYFTSLLNGASEVSVFDVNYTAWLFFRIKFKAIRVLDYNDFVKLFIYRKFNDIDIYNKMYNHLTYDELNYYVYLANQVNNNYRYCECFHPNTLLRVNDKERLIPYIDVDNYYRLKEIISKRKLPKFYLGDFMKLPIKSGYDIILLSNIYDYVDSEVNEFREHIDRYQAIDVLARYCFSFNDEDDVFLDNGFVISTVEGLMNDKNYVLSLKRGR